jgi:hypothetical protein
LRKTVRKYSKIAKEQRYLEKTGAQPDEAELMKALGPGVQAPKQALTVEPYRDLCAGFRHGYIVGEALQGGIASSPHPPGVLPMGRQVLSW